MSEKASLLARYAMPETGRTDRDGIPATNELPAPLNTGHTALDFEHRQLLAVIATVRSLCDEFATRPDCSSCAQSKRERCEDNLIGILGDLLAYVLDHFQCEERIMRESFLINIDRAVCEAHMEDHANISYNIQQIVAGLDPERNVVMIRELNALLVRWVENHLFMHDRLLVEHVASTGMFLRKNSS